jgi:hypothetical protein
MEETDDRNSGKLGDTKRKTVLEKISSKKKYREKEKQFWCNLLNKKKKYQRSMGEFINRSIKISMKGRIKALRRRKERGKEPFIIGVYDNKFITWEEILQARKRREELTYEIYRKYVPFEKKELIIKDKRSNENRVHYVNWYLKL